MTLASVPRFEQTEVSVVGEHAVVVGAGIAGLAAARVLADGFKDVTLIERDPLPDEMVSRNGVPHARHPHAFKEAGRATIEDLFPGYRRDFISAGGLIIDISSDFNYYDEGDFLADGPQRKPMYTASRPLFEHVARQHVLDLDNVCVRAGCRCTEYLIEDQSTVAGVVIRESDAESEEILADLVVDATGRTSRTPTWLEENGYEPPAVDEVQIDLAYSTLLVERPPDDRRAIWVPPSAPHTRGGGAAPIEDGYWQVVMNGVHGDHPPTHVDEFMDFAKSLPCPELEILLERHPRASDEIDYYPFPSSHRYRYEDLDRFPDGLLVIGDAIASYNPIYGQGISVAALEAVLLHHVLATGDRENLAFRFFEQAAEVIDIAWMMAVGADFRFVETTGSKPLGTDLMGRYFSRLVRKAHTDGTLREKLFRVIMMEIPPTALLRPGIVWQVLRPAGRS